MPTRQGGSFWKNAKNVATLQLMADYYFALRINAVDLKNLFCNVETDCRDRFHGWLLRIVGPLTAPTSMALVCRWRSRPQHHFRTHALHKNRGDSTAAILVVPDPGNSSLV